jgi:thiol:disulfide interchange protein DsbD
MNARKLQRRFAFAATLASMLVAIPAFVCANPDDPFDPANKAVILSSKTRKLIEIIRFEAQASPAKVKRGELVRIVLTGTPAKGYHAFPITMRTPDQVPVHPEIAYSGVDGIRALWPIMESDPHLVREIDKSIVLEHNRPFTWSQDLLVDASAKSGKFELTITIKNLQVCNDGGCYGPDAYKPLYVPIEIIDGEVVGRGNYADRLKGPPEVKVIAPTPEDIAKLNADHRTPAGATPAPGEVDAHNLWSFLWFASLSAFLMLLTPCVFPMIPITVNFFLKQSEKEHYNPLKMASVYSGTIIVLLTAIMLVLGKIVINLANNEWFNLALGLMLVVFALSLFGMYEIELPHFLSRFTSEREGKGGVAGAMFMAMTFTITSFTCTGPFLGLMLGSVASVRPPMLNLVLGAIVYSTTFAAPFFVLALFPSLLKKLPKSGGWLNAVKVTMGFLELGAALKFLSNADLAFFPGNPQLFNYDTVLASWIALSISCSLYLLGFFRLPHDDKVESIGVIRMLIAAGFLALSIYLAPAMFGLHPAGVIGDNAIAFLPIRTGHTNDAVAPGGSSSGGSSTHGEWYLDYEDAWKDAIANNKLIFIDFTGANCSNCRYNESSVFPLPQVQDELKKLVKVSLYTDSVPNPKLSRADSKKQGERNAGWQDVLAKNDATLPTYIILRPARDAALEDGKPKGMVLGSANGAIFDVPGFVRVLQRAQATQTTQLRDR